MAEELINPAQAAAIAGCHEDTIRRAIQTGNLPAQRIGQRTWAIRASDLQIWIEKGMPNSRRKSTKKGDTANDQNNSGTGEGQ